MNIFTHQSELGQGPRAYMQTPGLGGQHLALKQYKKYRKKWKHKSQTKARWGPASRSGSALGLVTSVAGILNLTHDKALDANSKCCTGASH